MFPQLDQQHLDQSIEKPWQLVFSARSPVPLRPLKRWSPGRGYLTGFFSEAKTNQKIASFWWPGRPLIYSIQTPDEQKIMSIKIRKALRLQYPEIMNCMQLFLVYLQIWILWIMFHQKKHDSIFHGTPSRPYRSGGFFLHNMDLDLGIWVWKKVWQTIPWNLSKHFLDGSRKFGYTMHIQDVQLDAALQIYAPLQIFQQQNTIKTRPAFLRPELAEWPPTILLCTTTGFKKRHLLRCNNVEVGSQVLDVSNLSKNTTWCEHPVLSRVPWKTCQAVFRWNTNNQQETCVFLMIMFHVYCNYKNNEDYVFFLGPNWYWFSSLDKRFSFRCCRWIKIHTENPCGFTSYHWTSRSKTGYPLH